MARNGENKRTTRHWGRLPSKRLLIQVAPKQWEWFRTTQCGHSIRYRRLSCLISPFSQLFLLFRGFHRWQKVKLNAFWCSFEGQILLQMPWMQNNYAFIMFYVGSLSRKHWKVRRLDSKRQTLTENCSEICSGACLDLLLYHYFQRILT